jgi:hypothetical protein
LDIGAVELMEEGSKQILFESIIYNFTCHFPLTKCNLLVKFSSVSLPNSKKLRENLIQKHARIPIACADSVIDEIENYLTLNVSCDDDSSKNTCPHLESFPQIVLAIPSIFTSNE